MTYDPDDPRWTAYALGELQGTERDEFEALAASHPEASRCVDETRALARVLADQLRAEPAPSLTDEQRRRIQQQARTRSVEASPSAAIPFLFSGRRWLRHAFAAAALLAVGFGTFTLWRVRYAAEPAAFRTEATQAPAPSSSTASEAKTATAADRFGTNEFARVEPLDAMSSIAENEGRKANEPVRVRRLAKDAIALGEAVATSPASPTSHMELAKQRDSGTTIYAAAPAISDGTSAGASQLGITSEAGQAGGNNFGYGLPIQTRSDGAESAGLMAAGGMRGATPADSNKFYDRQESLARGGAVLDFQSNAQGAPAAPTNEDLMALGGRFAQQGQANKPGQAHQAGEELGQNTLSDEVHLFSLQSGVTQQSTLGRRLLSAAEATPKEQRVPEPPPARPAAVPAAQPVPALVEAEALAEQYAPIVENDFVAVLPQNTLATFSTDVDTGSYSNMRRMLSQNIWPRRDAVRIEELLNYFPYSYPEPEGDDPFSINNELTTCPWNSDHWLLRVGLKGRSIEFANRAPTNLVFLVDVSGSMDQPNKLPLVKAGLRMLTEQLGENDTITMVTYAGNSSLALPPTSGQNQAEIASAIDQLQPGGSTNGAGGINLAYSLAAERFLKNGVNRVILATDGDFNVGVSSVDELVRLAEEKAKTGVFLSVLGVGEANLKDQNLEQIADKGNGQYSYLDTLLEARKVLVEQAGGTLLTIAKDVKIQVDFNPAKVGAYRLIGYENRALQAQDFRDDTKDAGEIGSGHTVTALFELIPPEAPAALALRGQVEPSRYAKTEVKDEAKRGDEFLNVALRFKAPDADTSRERNVPVTGPATSFGDASDDTRFASAVALFGMILRESKHKGSGSLDAVLEIAAPAATAENDPGGYRREFLDLVAKAKSLQPENQPVMAAPVP